MKNFLLEMRCMWHYSPISARSGVACFRVFACMHSHRQDGEGSSGTLTHNLLMVFGLTLSMIVRVSCMEVKHFSLKHWSTMQPACAAHVHSIVRRE